MVLMLWLDCAGSQRSDCHLGADMPVYGGCVTS
jgi:hypothetical protein